jgi:DNA (cytosine-5)-methyltransferase 1
VTHHNLTLAKKIIKLEMPCNSPGIISVFSGAGGLDLGFSQAGFRTFIALDNENSAVDSFNRNHPAKVARFE